MVGWVRGGENIEYKDSKINKHIRKYYQNDE